MLMPALSSPTMQEVGDSPALSALARKTHLSDRDHFAKADSHTRQIRIRREVEIAFGKNKGS